MDIIGTHKLVQKKRLNNPERVQMVENSGTKSAQR